MLSYFRINDPYRLISVGLLIFLAAGYFLIRPLESQNMQFSTLLAAEKLGEGFVPYSEIIESSGPLALFSEWVHTLLFGRNQSWRGVTGLILLLFQAFAVNIIFIRRKVLNENTFVPCVLFALLGLIAPDAIYFSNQTLGGFWLVLLLNYTLKEIEFTTEKKGIMLTLGILLSFASLTSLDMIIYLPVIILVLGLFTRLNLMHYLLLLSGFILPHILLISGYYLADHSYELFEVFYSRLFHLHGEYQMSHFPLALIFPAVFLVIAFIALTREARYTKYQNQVAQTMFIFMIAGFVHFLWFSNRSSANLGLILFPATYYISGFFLLLRKRRLAEGLFTLFIVGTLTTSYVIGTNLVPLENPVTRVKASEVDPETIWIVNSGPESYRGRKSALLIDPVITANWLAAASEYRTIERLYVLLQLDPPNRIIDAEGKAAQVLKRMPYVERGYSRAGTEYRKLAGNF